MERRRAIRAGLSVALAGLAGCGSGAATGTRSTVAPDRPPCADGFRIVDREERIARGTVPEVRFQLRNDGDVTVAYDLRVQFEQATSTGLREPSGRDRITGTLAPGASVDITATTDSAERTSTTDYSLDVTLACGSAPADV
ncbi:MAG: hypothetical protein ABEH58_01070 [Haloplanus sp.]